MSRESIKPIASIAPPSISVRSLIVAELWNESTLRVGERSGRLGPVREATSCACGDDSVLTMVGKALLRVLGDTESVVEGVGTSGELMGCSELTRDKEGEDDGRLGL